MDKECQDKCFLLIKKYKKLKQKKAVSKCRNELYDLFSYDILTWTKSTLSKWKRYLEKEELLSISWDIFIYCLDNYNPALYAHPLPYFYRYTNYWLFIYFSKKDEGLFLPIEELEDTLKIVDSPENIAFGKLLRLYKMRETIPDDSKVVWDDAFLSLNNSERKRDNYRSKEIGMGSNTYLKLKRSFKGLIRFVLEN